MFDRIVEDFCAIDDFYQVFQARWRTTLVTDGTPPGRKRGPAAGLANSGIMTILILCHGSNSRNSKAFYQGVVLTWLRSCFPAAPCHARFIALTDHVWVPLTFFLLSRMGARTGVYDIDSTPLPVCHNRRIPRHKVFADLAARGKTSLGWFLGFKLHLVFNPRRQIVALRLTPGNVSDTKPVDELTQGLVGKLFGDKGYIGKDLAAGLLRRGLALMTRVRRNMKRMPVSFLDKTLLNARGIAETIIGHIKEFSSLRLPKHRPVTNAFTHLIAALVAYQLNPLSPRPIRACVP